MHADDIARYQHTHVFHYSGTDTERKTLRVVFLTVVMMVVEIVAGWMFNSMALLADGWHMSTHAAALGIAWGAFILARRNIGNRDFAFGTWKIEIIGGFVSAILLGIVALAMTYVSIERLFRPAVIQFNEAILVAGIGLAVNLASIFLLAGKHHSHDHARRHDEHHSGREHNLNLRAAYLHVIADALTSVLAIVALIGGKYMGWNWLDPAMGIVGAIMISSWTYKLLLATGNILLDRSVNPGMEKKIRDAIESDGDTKICDLHLWQVGQENYACVLSVIARNPRDLRDYKNRLRDINELAHVTIEIERCTDSAGGNDAPACARRVDS